jgi:FtsP/CotA-like multicopper oxidase with cupredoxin domain
VSNPGVTQVTTGGNPTYYYITNSAKSGTSTWVTNVSSGQYMAIAWSIPSSTKSATTAFTPGVVLTVNQSTGEATIGNYPYTNQNVTFNTPDYCYFAMFMQDGNGANTFTPAAGVSYNLLYAANFMNYNILMMRIPASIWAGSPSGGIIGTFGTYYAQNNPSYL